MGILAVGTVLGEAHPVEAQARSPLRKAATLLGVTLALGVPLALFPTGLIERVMPLASEGQTGRELFMWGLTALVLLVLTLGEGLPLSAIGLKGLRWSSLLWGVVGFGAVLLCYPLGGYLLRAVGGTMPTGTMQQLASLPVPMLALILVRAAVTEEILFRGYGIERLTALTGSRAIGAVVPWLIFTLAHMQAWGLTYIVVVAPVAAVLTILYLWRRDLVANIIAHFLTDAFGISMAYAFSHHLIKMPGN